MQRNNKRRLQRIATVLVLVGSFLAWATGEAMAQVQGDAHEVFQLGGRVECYHVAGLIGPYTDCPARVLGGDLSGPSNNPGMQPGAFVGNFFTPSTATGWSAVMVVRLDAEGQMIAVTGEGDCQFGGECFADAIGIGGPSMDRIYVQSVYMADGSAYSAWHVGDDTGVTLQSVGGWHVVQIAYTSTGTRWYVDGQLVYTDPSVRPLITANNTASGLGADPWHTLAGQAFPATSLRRYVAFADGTAPLTSQQVSDLLDASADWEGFVLPTGCRWDIEGNAETSPAGAFNTATVTITGEFAAASLAGAACQASGIGFTVMTEGDAGAVMRWRGADGATYGLQVTTDGRLRSWRNGALGVDLGEWRVGLQVQWETGQGRFRSRASSGSSWSAWTSVTPGAAMVRVNDRLFSIGDVNGASNVTVLQLGGSAGTAIGNGGTGGDPTGGPEGSVRTGCDDIESIGLNPSSWVPALLGGVECVVSGVLDKTRAWFVPTKVRSIVDRFQAVCEAQAPCSWVTGARETLEDVGTLVGAPYGPLPAWCSDYAIPNGSEVCVGTQLNEMAPPGDTSNVIVTTVRILTWAALASAMVDRILRTNTAPPPQQLSLF